MKRIIGIGLVALALPLSVFAQNCIPSGVTDQYTYFVAVNATDRVTRETGLMTFSVRRSRNGGASVAFTTPTINETDSANMPGVYELLLDEDMTIDAGDDVQHMALHITATGMAPVTKEICIARSKITAGNTLSVASDGDLLEVNALTGHTAQTGDAYARLGAPVGASVSADLQTVAGNVNDIETLAASTGVRVSPGTGTGQLSITSGRVAADMQAVSGDTAAADRWEAMLDGTCGSYPELGILRGIGCTAASYNASTPSLTIDGPAAFADDTLRDATVIICGSTQGYCQPAIVASNVGDVLTLQEELTVTPSGTITFTIFGTKAAAVPVDVGRINGVQICGAGTEADPFNGC